MRFVLAVVLGSAQHPETGRTPAVAVAVDDAGLERASVLAHPRLKFPVSSAAADGAWFVCL